MVTARCLSGALVASVLALSCACSGSSDGPRTSPARTPAPGRAAAARGSHPSSTLDLAAMLAPVPEYEGQGRNLFAFGAERRVEATVSAPEPDEPEIDPVPAPTMPRPTPVRPTPGGRIDVKYAGFLEKTSPDGTKAKYAIFLDGNEILAGSEGETLASRFTVVEIGLESVTVSPTGTTVTQRIPLQSN
jgi:hypothetical protein